MSKKHTSIQQLRLYMGYRKMGDTQELAAAKAGISLSTAKRIEQNGIVNNKRNYRTRTDPFEKVWEEELVLMLETKPTLSAITLLDFIQDKYPGKYPDQLLRTMQRRVKNWKAHSGPEKEIMFEQEHYPGLLGLSDFTQLKDISITINKKTFDHILYHFRLSYSGWSYIKIIEGGESFTALAENFQSALWRLGGAPKEHRTDSLSAAFKNLTRDEKQDLTTRYTELCVHYGIKPTRNNLGCKHENGSIESSHRHMKRRLKQALVLRESCDFTSVIEYQLFIDAIVQKHNKKNYQLIKHERKSLLDLPSVRTCDYENALTRVASTSTIRVKNVVYSVPSRLIGENIRVHIYDNRLECYLGVDFLFNLPRIRAKHRELKKVINYKHMINSLSKKPGAFGKSSIKNDILPSQDYIEIWKYLELKCERQQACKIIVGILQLAKDTSKELEIAMYVKQIILSDKIPYLELLRTKFLNIHNKKTPIVTVKNHDLKSYNLLINTKEVDHANNS